MPKKKRKRFVRIKTQIVAKVIKEREMWVAFNPIFSIATQGETRTQAIQHFREVVELYSKLFIDQSWLK